MIAAVVSIFVLALGWAGLVALGVWLVWHGVQGRMVDRTPRCRRCGYVLISEPRRPLRCSECGAGLDVPGTVCLGIKRRSAPRVAAGSMILVTGATLLWYALLPQAQAAPTVRKLARPVVRSIRPLPRTQMTFADATSAEPLGGHPAVTSPPARWTIFDLYMPTRHDMVEPVGEAVVTVPRPRVLHEVPRTSSKLLSFESLFESRGERSFAPVGPSIPIRHSAFEQLVFEPRTSRIEREPLQPQRIERLNKPARLSRRNRASRGGR